MRPEIALIANSQAGLITRRQMHDLGVREPEYRALTRAHGPLVAVRRGVFIARQQWEDAAQSRDGQASLRDRAAHLAMRRPHVMSHDSAARLLGIPFLTPKFELIHATREGVGGSRTERGVKHHLTRLGLLNTVTVDGVCMTGPARTAVDMGREHGLATGVVAADAVRRRGTALADLEAELRVMKSWRGVVAARDAVLLSDPGAESPGESLLRLAVLELGIGAPRTQFPIARPRGVAWVDVVVGRHAFEFDGRLKFRRSDVGGVASGPVEDVLWDERTRQNDIAAAGFGVSRVTWSECFGRGRRPMLDRLRREYELTRTRFGDSLPEDARAFAEQMQEARARRLRSDDLARR